MTKTTIISSQTLEHFKPGCGGFTYQIASNVLGTFVIVDLLYVSGFCLGQDIGKIAVRIALYGGEEEDECDPPRVITVCDCNLGRSRKYRDQFLTPIALLLDEHLPQIAAMFQVNEDTAVKMVEEITKDWIPF